MAEEPITATDPSVVSTRHWHWLGDGRIQCDICPRACKLKEGQRGLCFVRGRVNDEVVLTTWGRSSGFAVDPIEKKPLNHFLPGSSVLSFGTAGCNLNCKFCQNWDMSKARQMDRLMDQAQPEAIARQARALDCRSVAYTYNDPVIFHEYALDVGKACHEQGLYNVAVTAGYLTDQARPEFFSVMDAVNFDLKAFTEEFYWKVTGSHLQPCLDSMLYVRHETDAWMELTTLLIPGYNDSDEEIHEMTQWVVENLGEDVPMHFTAFHPDFRMKDVPPTPPSTLTRARQIALENGIRYAYTGNVHDSKGGSTYCHECGTVLIERDWFRLGTYNLDDRGHCLNCGTTCAGVFDGAPGQWGKRRMRVKMA